MKNFKSVISGTALSLAMVMSMSSGVSAGKFVGLQNIGKSAYINAAIQTLYSNEDFKEKIALYDQKLNIAEDGSRNVNAPTVARLKELFDLMETCREKGYLEKEQIKNVIMDLSRNATDLSTNAVISSIVGDVEKEVGEKGLADLIISVNISAETFDCKYLQGVQNGDLYKAKALVVKTGCCFPPHHVTWIRNDEGCWVKISDSAVGIRFTQEKMINNIKKTGRCQVVSVMYELDTEGKIEDLEGIEKLEDLKEKGIQPLNSVDLDFFSMRQLDRKRPKLLEGVTGLVNVGNSCYINSAIQILYADKDFKQKIYSYDQELNVAEDGSRDVKASTIDKLKQLFDLMDGCTQEYLSAAEVGGIIKNLVPGLYNRSGGFVAEAVTKILNKVNKEAEGKSPVNIVREELMRNANEGDYNLISGEDLRIENLTLQRNDMTYRARAISVHPLFHFITYVRLENDNWVEINDSHVSPEMTESEMLEKVKKYPEVSLVSYDNN